MRKTRKRKVQTIFKICRPGGKKKPPAVFIADGWRCALPLSKPLGVTPQCCPYPLTLLQRYNNNSKMTDTILLNFS